MKRGNPRFGTVTGACEPIILLEVAKSRQLHYLGQISSHLVIKDLNVGEFVEWLWVNILFIE